MVFKNAERNLKFDLASSPVFQKAKTIEITMTSITNSGKSAILINATSITTSTGVWPSLFLTLMLAPQPKNNLQTF